LVEPDALFQWIEPQPDPVNILSTARPPRPDIRAVVPSFQWQRTVTATRVESVRSSRLRAEAAAPWYETGEGERLAVVIASTDPAVPVTRLGRTRSPRHRRCR
jgi:hypothetical protein